MWKYHFIWIHYWYILLNKHASGDVWHPTINQENVDSHNREKQNCTRTRCLVLPNMFIDIEQKIYPL